MKGNSNYREILTRILLSFSAFLFSASIVLAQEKSTGRTTIKIMKKENGKTTKIDTTFDSNDDEAVRKILKDFDDHKSFQFSVPEPLSELGSGHRKMKFKYHGLSKSDRDELKKEMEELDDEMNDLREKMKDIKIEIFSDNAENGKNGYSYHFEMPPMPPMPEMHDGVISFYGHDFGKQRRHGFFSPIPDSLDDGDHAIIMADNDELPPVFEKEITGKHGEKVFVYKRMRPADKKSKDHSLKENEISLYPNPNNGTFSLRFQSGQKSSVTIKVYDQQGKEVYSEVVKNFNGEYLGPLDLSAKWKGNYILKITQDDQTHIKKFIIE